MLERTGNLSVSVIVGQIRSTAADLLAATGMSYDAVGRRGARGGPRGGGLAVSGLGWEQVRAWRVRPARARRARARLRAAPAVASRLCGVHAQLMGSAELTLWARLEALDPGAVAAALWEDRTLVKTWAMRGTLHLLPAGELGLWLAGLGHLRPLPQAGVDPRLRHLRGGSCWSSSTRSATRSAASR